MNFSIETIRTSSHSSAERTDRHLLPEMFHFMKRDHRWYVATFLGVITAGHYLLPAEHHLLHNLLQRLYYAPIVWAAYQFGARGGALAAIVAGVLYLPHVIFGWSHHPEYQVNQFIEIILFVAIGLSAGYLFDQKVGMLRQLQSYERMALFGSLSRTIIRSLKNPIRIIEGMIMALEPRERRDPALAASLGIIRTEVGRIERVREDLIALVQRRALRLKTQNLNDLMFGFVSQIEASLSMKGIGVRRSASGVKVMANLNGEALLGILHPLVSAVIRPGNATKDLCFYTGQSTQYAWLGATAGTRELEHRGPGDLEGIDSDPYYEYDLVSIYHVMNNHYGEIRWRWCKGGLVEFLLLFPRRLKLPWYLRDEPAGRTARTDAPTTAQGDLPWSEPAPG